MKRIPAPPVRKLTTDEQRILDAFRKMDQRGKSEYVVLMEQTAAKWPQHAVSELRLVSGGAS